MEDTKTNTYDLKKSAFHTQPREKLMAQGPDVLKHAELLAIILNTGYKEESVVELASRILQEYGSRAITQEKSVKQLMAELGLPTVKACQIVACFELGRRFFKEDTGRMKLIRDAQDVFEHLREHARSKKEVLFGIYLNARNRIIHEEVISIGTVNASLVHPREVLQPGIEFSAAAFIIAHNHPSGTTEASEEDIHITKRLVAAAQVMGIELVDHIIFTHTGYSSMREKGII